MSWWLFEGAIWFFLVVTGAALIDIFTKYGKKVLKQRLLLLVSVVLLFSWSVVFYGSFIEPQILVVNKVDVDLPGLNKSVRVAVLSDIHVGPYKNYGWVHDVVTKTNAQNPDAVFLLGDYVFGHLGQLSDLDALSGLSAPLGVYAVLGNHDYDGDRQYEIKEKLESLGIKVLINTSEIVSISESEKICLAGLGDLWNRFDFEQTLNDCLNQENILLLSHNPDAILFEQSQVVDLMISGHTHGGQIRLPFFGAVSKIPTILDKSFNQGLFESETSKFFVTSGLGETGPRARLFNPPEIAILELK